MSLSPIRAVIVDDETSGIEVLEYTLKRHCKDVEVIKSFTSSLEAAEAIPLLQPDVLFVDVEMPQLNGFELVEKLSKLNIQFIFTTAYNEFALKAFRVSALDYLLKPIDADELKSAVNKLKSIKREENPAMDALLEYMKTQQQVKKISIPTDKGIVFIEISQVLYCKSDGPYTTFQLEGGASIISSKSLGEYEQQLSDKGFYRIHNSSLINVQHLKKFIRQDGGYVEMSNGQSLTVSRRKRDEFLDYLGH
jgi:two-component system LytT family response regulator